MSRVLIDANVLIALAWPAHVFHQPALRWFAKSAQRGWATCPITEAALVRTLSNRAFSSDALSPQQALAVLEVNTAHEHHHFWPDDLSLSDAISRSAKRIAGHKQITDAYLLALAARHRASFATFDKPMRELAPVIGVTVELIGAS